MGESITRCMKVDELMRELKRYDRDLIVRLRDGDAVLPGVFVMMVDRTDHVDVGCPYPVRKRLAEIDAAVRKNDGRPKKRGPKVWVLIRRYEWAADANQTERCDTFVFTSRCGAVHKAASLLRDDMGSHGFESTDIRDEEKEMLAAFRSSFPRHLVQIADGDNVVYELYCREVRQ